MRKILLSTVALVAMAGVAFAADLPSTKARPCLYPAGAGLQLDRFLHRCGRRR